jgi:hypothetical protein
MQNIVAQKCAIDLGMLDTSMSQLIRAVVLAMTVRALLALTGEH